MRGLHWLFLLLVTSGSCIISGDRWIGEVDFVRFERSEPLGEEQSLDARVEVKVGRLEVEPGPADQLYQIEVHYNQRAFTPQLDVQREGTGARLEFELTGEGSSFAGLDETRINLRLNPNLPVQLETRSGVGESNVDLSGMEVRSVLLQSGVGEHKLSMLTPNRTICDRIEIISGVGALEVVGLGNFAFKELRFRGGVGGSSLDFSGAWNEVGQVEIEVGVGGVEILLPRHLGAEIRVSKSFLTGYDLSGFTQKGDTYYSDNLERVEKVVRFRIRAGIGGVEVKWI